MAIAHDTSKEKAYFVGRSTVKRTRAVKKEVVTTTLIEKPKRKGSRGNAFQHTRTGARSDLNGLVVRSNWEANFVRVLNLHKIPFQFEPLSFRFPPNPKTGIAPSYIPDFYLPEQDEFVEVKGYLDGRGRNKLRKFRKHFPEQFAKLTVVISRSNKANLLFFTKLGVKNILFYENIGSLYSAKVNWEGK